MLRRLLPAGVGFLLALQAACAAQQAYVAERYDTPHGTGVGAVASYSTEEADFDDVRVSATGFSANDAPMKTTMSYPTRSAPAVPPTAAPPPSPPPAPVPAKEEGPEPPSSLQANRGPMLIYTAHLSLATFETEAALVAVEKLAKDNGGFLSNRERLAITIRVPSERFTETLQAIEKLGDVIDRNVKARDVTDEFFDMEARLRSARAVHARLVELLQKADKVEESIAIEKELGRVLAEIERLEGRLKLLRDQLAYSTITASFRPKSTEIIGKKTPFRLPGEWLDQLGLGRLMRL